MVLAAVGLIVPALFHQLVGPGAAGPGAQAEPRGRRHPDRHLRPEPALQPGDPQGPDQRRQGGRGRRDPTRRPGGSAHVDRASCSSRRSFVAWMSEVLVGAVEEASRGAGAERGLHGRDRRGDRRQRGRALDGVLMALKNQMDLAVGIAMGSALQIALFVAPVLVFVSYLRRRRRWTCSSRPGGRRRDPRRS